MAKVFYFQGRESIEWIREYAESFKTNLQNTFKRLNPDRPEPLTIKCVLASRKRTAKTESAAPKIKDKNEQGYEE